MSDNTEAFAGLSERKFLGRLLSLLKPPERVSTKEYAEKYRFLSSDVTATPGKMDCSKTPFMFYPMECLDDLDVKIMVARKSAQIAWTETINSYIAKHMDIDPRNIIIAFPSLLAAKSYSNEKLRPLIRSSPRISKLIGNLSKCSFNFYKFPGGYVKLITAGSVIALKSSTAPILIVEEPSDLLESVGKQGATLDVFSQRNKTFLERMLVYGGTPTDENCKVNAAFQLSNKLVFKVPCPSCGVRDVLDFKNLKCEKFQDKQLRPIYGYLDPSTAYYECPHCGDRWDDAKKEAAVLEAATSFDKFGWVATADSPIVGFSFNELMSSVPGSSMEILVQNRIKALTDKARGKEEKLRAYTNNSMGLPYVTKVIKLSESKLKDKRLDYPEMVVHAGGLVVTMGVDVQHDRLAIILRAFGRAGNSWLVYWGEIYGNPKDLKDEVWQKLTEIYLAPIPHQYSTPEVPLNIPISALSIDSSDGGTTQVVYRWVAERLQAANRGIGSQYIHAIKGSSDIGVIKAPIYAVPNNFSGTSTTANVKTLAETFGLSVYIVGTQLAKDELYRKLSLDGKVDRMYHYADCREDYEAQVTSNEKRFTPSGNPHYKLAGRADEALDCEMYALHATMALRLHLYTEASWRQLENSYLKPRSLRKINKLKVTGGV